MKHLFTLMILALLMLQTTFLKAQNYRNLLNGALKAATYYAPKVIIPQGKSSQIILDIPQIINLGTQVYNSGELISTSMESFPVRSIHFPSVQVPNDLSYDMRIHAPIMNYGVIPTAYQINGFHLQGWNIDYDNPGIGIDLYLEDPILKVGNTIVRRDERIIQNTRGHHRGMPSMKDSVDLYSAQIIIQGKGRVVVEDQNGNPIFQRSLQNYESSITTPEFMSRRQLENYINRMGDQMLQPFMKEFYNYQISRTSECLNSVFGLYEYDAESTLALIKTKRDPLYNEVNNRVLMVRTILQNYVPMVNGDEIEQQLRSHEEYFVSLMNRMNGNDRRSKVIKYIAAHNLTSMNFAIDRFNETSYYANIWKGIGKDTYMADDYLAKSYDRKSDKMRNMWNF